MLQIKKNVSFCILIGYLCLFTAFLPCRVNGALLSSKRSLPLSPSQDKTWSHVIHRMVELGLPLEEARQRVAFLQVHRVPFNKSCIFAGGEPPADYDPPMNNIGLVFLCLGIAVGIGVYAGLQTAK